MSPVDLRDYVDVKARIALFYARHPDGRLVTTDVRATAEPDGVPRVWVEAAAYRTADDPLPGRGWSWMVLPGSTNFTRGSEIENTETSAWGRAIGACGIGIEGGIASADEIRAKAAPESKVERGDDGSLIGTVEVGDKMTSDFLVRQTPTGSALGFRLRGDKGAILVQTTDALADQLYANRDAVVGARITAWGRVHDIEVPATARKAAWSYPALSADRVKAPGIGVLPVDTTPEPDEALQGVVGLTEAESAALWEELDRAKATGLEPV